MLAIRLQRKGRKGHAQFRVIVQESRLSPKSGRVVANLGAYDPHTKVATLDTEKAEYYLTNGAQPSDRVVRIFTFEKVKMPSWVEVTDKQSRSVRNPEKLRKNMPKEEAPAAEAETAPEETPAADEAPEAEAPVEEKVTDEAPEAEEKTEKAD